MSGLPRRLTLIILALALVACTEPSPPTVGLDRAVRVGDLDQIKRHIHWGSDLDQPNAEGDPPLHVAARDGRVAIARELIRRGADVERQNALGATPLAVALANGRTQVAMLLVLEGATLDAQAMLFDLTRAGVIDRDALDFLIGRGARLDQPDGSGDTALHIAIRQGHLVTVRRLIIAGVDVNHPDGAGRLPLRIARESAPGPDARFIISTLERSGGRADPNH